MAKADYYEVLGVTRTCTEIEMKAAFRKAAMQYHPDRNPGNSEAEHKFKELNEAYQTLSDAQKRAAYDRFGHAAFENGGSGAGGFAADGFGSSMADIFDDLFGDMMGRRGGRQGAGGAGRGSDLRYNMEITLEEAFHGKTASLKLPTSVSCDTCAGSGAKPGAKPRTCSMCHGQGRVRAQQGFFAIERTCPTCQGRGEMIDNPCTACAGSGRVTRERQLSVNIPAGVEDGTRIRLSGEGEAGTRGGPARATSTSSSRPSRTRSSSATARTCSAACRSRWCRRRSAARSPCAPSTAARPRSRFPKGTQSGKQFKVRSKGMPVLRSRDIGDLYIQTTVETPQSADAPPARAARRVRGRKLAQDAPGGVGLLRQDEGLLREFERGVVVGLCFSR